MPTSVKFELSMMRRWPSLGGVSLYIRFCKDRTPSRERFVLTAMFSPTALHL